MATKLLSTTGLQTLYGELTNNRHTTHKQKGLNTMNDRYLQLCNAGNWPFLEELYSFTSVASQQAYELPADTDKVKMVSMTLGTERYVAESISSWNEWEAVNNPTSWESDYIMYYFMYNEELNVWPVPATTGKTIRTVFRKKPKRLTIEDYTTGTVSAVTNGATTVTGSGTSWTAAMEGAYIIIDKSFTANQGDGCLYQIETVNSTTELVLSRPYRGETITAGSATYTIGEVPLIPQEYAHALAYWAAYVYWASQDNGQQRASNMAEMYNEIINQMVIEAQSRATSVDIEPVFNDNPMKNPNLWITTI